MKIRFLFERIKMKIFFLTWTCKFELGSMKFEIVNDYDIYYF